MLIETLENRRLLSASLNTTTGLLTITGTDFADRIAVFKYNGEIVVAQATLIPGTASTPARVETHRWEFDATKVKSILANANGGNDVVDVGGYRSSLPVASTTGTLPTITPLSIPAGEPGGRALAELLGTDVTPFGPLAGRWIAGVAGSAGSARS